MKTVVRPLMAAGLTTVLLSTVTGGSAGAAAGAAETTGAAKATVSAQAKTKRGDRIKCEIETHNAHYSHHAGQKNRHRVNVVADIDCDNRSVTRLSMAVGLYKNGKIYKRSGVKTNYSKSFLKQNASRRCVKKQKYAGYAKGSVLFPPGYHPRTAKLADRGPERTIWKCKKGG